MGDSDDDKATSIPAWQREATEDKPDTEPQPAQDHLETARRFLEDTDVKDAPREKKVAFLKGKGIEDGDIDRLLGAEETQIEDEVGFPLLWPATAANVARPNHRQSHHHHLPIQLALPLLRHQSPNLPRPTARQS